MENPSDYFVVSIISHDNRAVAKSIADLGAVANILGRRFILNMQIGTGIPPARQRCLDAIKKFFPDQKEAYTLWIDSDIILNDNPDTIAKYITEAEQRGVSFTANYRTIDVLANRMWNVAGPEWGKHYTDDELKNAKPFDLKCGNSGLGLCYLKMPLDYKFRMTHNEGEDEIFFRENPSLDVRYVPITNLHMKTVYL